jgi:hypothetical protein
MTKVIDITNKIRIYVNQDDHAPAHCHIMGKGGEARINFITFEVMSVQGFNKSDMVQILLAVKDNAEALLAMWEMYHGKKED